MHAPYQRVLDAMVADGAAAAASPATRTAASSACRSRGAGDQLRPRHRPRQGACRAGGPGPAPALEGCRSARRRHPRVPLAARVGRAGHLAVRAQCGSLPARGDPADPGPARPDRAGCSGSDPARCGRNRFRVAGVRSAILPCSSPAPVRVARHGVWRSLVARFVRDEEAAGSNPVTPTSRPSTSSVGGLRRTRGASRVPTGCQWPQVCPVRPGMTGASRPSTAGLRFLPQLEAADALGRVLTAVERAPQEERMAGPDLHAVDGPAVRCVGESGPQPARRVPHCCGTGLQRSVRSTELRLRVHRQQRAPVHTAVGVALSTGPSGMVDDAPLVGSRRRPGLVTDGPSTSAAVGLRGRRGARRGRSRAVAGPRRPPDPPRLFGAHRCCTTSYVKPSR